MLVIDIRTLEIGQHEFNLECSAEDINLEAGAMSDIRVDVHLQYDGREAIVWFNASAKARLLCDRTLVQFDLPIKGTYTILFSPKRPGEDEDGDVRPFSATDTKLDITDAVRDTLMLSIPIRKIAPGAEKTNIETSFGDPEEINDVDPRWQALLALKGKSDDAGATEDE